MAVFKIVHLTKYQYNWSIKESINEIRLFPHHFENQDVLQHELIISNNPIVETSQDYYGNRVGNFNIMEFHNEMSIESKMLVRVNHSQKIPEIDTTTVSDLEKEIERNITLLRLTYPENIKNQNKILAILKDINCENKPILQIAQECNEYVYTNFDYTQGITNISTTLDELLEIKKGVCQDFAHIMLQLLRTAGIPSRYVSGYVCSRDNGLRGEGATHAWVEVYTPNQGWLGLDPTNKIWAMDNHVKLSVGRNFYDCTLVKGTFKGVARQTLSVSVSIGYEDGKQFEGINKVKLNKEEEEETKSYASSTEQQSQQQ